MQNPFGMTIGGTMYDELLAQWVSVPFSAGMWTAQTGSWTVIAGNVITLQYRMLNRDMMFIDLTIQGSSVSSTPTDLRLLIPNGKSAVVRSTGPISVFDASASVSQLGWFSVAALSNVISFFKANTGGTWTGGSNCGVSAQMTLNVA